MRQALLDYTLQLADNALVMGHRLSEWAGHGPMLEQDIALSNIALDLVGQARNFYQYAAELANGMNDQKRKSEIKVATEDTLAYLRDARDFKNLLITETHNGDWGQTVSKLFFFSAFQWHFYTALTKSDNDTLSAIAEKSLKEVTYHRRWSSEWVIRLGDGTAESRARMQLAIDKLWSYTFEPFQPALYEIICADLQIGVDVTALRQIWLAEITGVLKEATLSTPIDHENFKRGGGKTGYHSEDLGFLLAEMQYLQRAYPGCEW